MLENRVEAIQDRSPDPQVGLDLGRQRKVTQALQERGIRALTQRRDRGLYILGRLRAQQSQAIISNMVIE